MAALSTNRIRWAYTDDFDVQYCVAAQKAVTDQALQGGEAADGTALPLPKGVKMRRTTVRNATNGVSRVIPVYAPGAEILTKGTSINLNYLGNSTAFLGTGTLISEQRARRSTIQQDT
jgi:hypothetical protein